MMRKIKKVYRTIRKTCENVFIYCSWLLFRPRPPIRDDNKKLLHIGCGSIIIPGFINIDARPLPHVHFLTKNLWNLGRFKTGTVDLIYMCHVLEHVHIHLLPSVIKELLRVLKIGGILRISVPDFDRIIFMYKQSNQKIESIEQVLMGGQMYRFNEHHSVFNKQYLETLFFDAGFRSVKEWNPETAEYRGFNDWASTGVRFEGRLFPISLNMEAIK